jgi:hypothetical protein
MISDDEKTPPLVPRRRENGRTPPPSLTPLPAVTPLPVATPRPTLALKKPPLGRPSGALTIAEMVDQITRDVRRFATVEVERRQAELRAELAGALQTATRLGLAAIVLTLVALCAVAVNLAR